MSFSKNYYGLNPLPLNIGITFKSLIISTIWDKGRS